MLWKVSECLAAFAMVSRQRSVCGGQGAAARCPDVAVGCWHYCHGRVPSGWLPMNMEQQECRHSTVLCWCMQGTAHDCCRAGHSHQRMSRSYSYH
jgi:hypothetical protein